MTTRIHTLGPIRIFRDDVERVDLLGQKLRCALLIYLALEHRATRDDLAALLWPERRPERARHSLSQALYELRQELGPDLHDVRGDVIEMTPEVDVDVLRMQECVDDARWSDALDLYRGAFLAGAYLVDGVEFEAWVDRWRSRSARLHRKARSKLLTEQRARGLLPEALAVAREWVEFEPLDDEAQHILIELLAESGRRSEALRHFATYQDLLARELEVEPLEQTRALVERIRGDPFAEPGQVDPSASGPTPRLAETTGGWSEAQLAQELAPELELVRILGEGSMAVVYLAREPGLRRLVAVKVLRPDLARDMTARLRFEREAQSAARISHPHVATIHSVGALSSGTPYIVMEYIHGRTLAEHRAALGILEMDDLRRILLEVASALAAAHAQRIAHRDVRPENVLIEEPSGRAVLTDFGLAAMLATGEDPGPRLTKTGEIVGNPVYLSPEQLTGDLVTEQADIYSLGMLAFDVATSARGREGSLTLAQLRARGARIASVREDADPEIDGLVARCLAAHAEERPTAAEVVAELRAISSPEGSEASTSQAGGLQELVERRVPHWLGAYLGASILFYEAMSQLVDSEALPATAWFVVLPFLVCGLLVTTVIAWFHGKKGPQGIPAQEIWILAGIVLVWVVSTVLVAAGL
jgi:DNA-binding SARP family transcriptional activator